MAERSDGRVVASLQSSRGAFRLSLVLDVPARGITAIFGPSGAGKTTCLRLLAGLDRGAGTVRVADDTWQDDGAGVFVPPHARSCGFVFQDRPLLPHLSIGANLEYARRRRRGPESVDAGSVLALARLDALLERAPAELSGGERTRAAIAQALLRQPRLLLLDEPLSALDHAQREETLRFLERLRDTASVPIVMVTHAVDEVARLAGHVVLLEAGAVIASGPSRAMITRLRERVEPREPASVVVEGTIAEHDLAGARTRVTFEGGSLWVAGIADRPMGAVVRVRVTLSSS